VIDRAVIPVIEQFAPELVLVSAGFDAHEQDPLAQMRATTPGLVWATSRLAAAADRVCDGRLVLVTEGGYALPALADSLEGSLRAIDERAPAMAAPEGLRASTGRGERALAALRAAQAGRWHGL
jgi:acetoin utilization deacetylase AcuC-like enzyme